MAERLENHGAAELAADALPARRRGAEAVREAERLRKLGGEAREPRAEDGGAHLPCAPPASGCRAFPPLVISCHSVALILAMPNASASSASLFSVLAFVVAIFVAWGLHRARVGLVPTIAILVSHIGIPGLLAHSGVLDPYDPLPAPALVLLLGLTLLTSAAALSPLGARLAAEVPLGAVVGLQAFRVPVELLLHRLYVEGAVPIQMTFSGRNFDVISGASGLVLGIWFASGRQAPRGVVLAWNVLGLALLANIVGIAILSTPVPFRSFVEGPANLLPSTFPYIWLPSFLVQVALGCHLLVFRQLLLGPR